MSPRAKGRRATCAVADAKARFNDAEACCPDGALAVAVRLLDSVGPADKIDAVTLPLALTDLGLIDEHEFVVPRSSGLRSAMHAQC